MPPKGVARNPPPPPASSADSPAMQQQRANSAGIADFELPRTTLTKLAKGSIPDNVKMQQDVVLALMRSSTMFISHLTAAAHDQATARSGKSITAADVLKAINEMDFGPADALIPLLEQELAAYRSNLQASKANKKPPGPGRGRGPRKSNAGQSGAEDVSMMDDGEGGEDEDVEYGLEGGEGDEDEGAGIGLEGVDEGDEV